MTGTYQYLVPACIVARLVFRHFNVRLVLGLLLPAGCAQHARLVLQLLCDFRVCLFVCLSQSGEAWELVNGVAAGM